MKACYCFVEYQQAMCSSTPLTDHAILCMHVIQRLTIQFGFVFSLSVSSPAGIETSGGWHFLCVLGLLAGRGNLRFTAFRISQRNVLSILQTCLNFHSSVFRLLFQERSRWWRCLVLRSWGTKWKILSKRFLKSRRDRLSGWFRGSYDKELFFLDQYLYFQNF